MELFCLSFEIFLVVAYELTGNTEFKKKLNWLSETEFFTCLVDFKIWNRGCNLI